MQIVIKIPKEIYEKIKHRRVNQYDIDDICQSVYDGIPLPEHHGRLIDADALQTEMDKDVRKAMSFVDLKDFVWLAQTIIEADR